MCRPLLRLHLYEDGSVKPSSRDADLQPPRRDRRQEQPAVLHDSHRRPQEEHDHRSDRQATGVQITQSPLDSDADLDELLIN